MEETLLEVLSIKPKQREERDKTRNEGLRS
jgi:hypothetical protein